MADLTPGAKKTVDGSDELWNAMYKIALDKSNGDGGAALRASMSAITNHIALPSVAYNIVGTFASTIADVLTLCVDQITKVKANSQNGIHDLFAALLSDALLLEIKGDDIPAATNAEGQAAVNSALGTKYLDAIKLMVGAEGEVTPESAEKGAAALVGLAMQMAVNTSFFAAAGGAIPVVHMEHLKELGEQLEKSLGLSRLIRRALTPLVQQTIALPLQQKYAAQYRQSILGLGELARAFLAPRMPAADARTLIEKHGLSDAQINELIEQHRPRLHMEEFEVLEAMGDNVNSIHAVQDVADGAANDVLDSRYKVLTWKRLSSGRNRVLTSVLSSIRDGFTEPADLDGWLTRFGVPKDEADLWRLAAGFDAERTRKRIDKGEMLFLYEASQVTDDDVRAWAKDEGYGSTDVERILAFFRLKAIEASHKTTGGAAAKAAHIHKEHVAYVTDEITGLWGRKPTTAELNYWVSLLDTNERTKGDFKTELKGLDTTGPAMPPATASS